MAELSGNVKVTREYQRRLARFDSMQNRMVDEMLIS